MATHPHSTSWQPASSARLTSPAYDRRPARVRPLDNASTLIVEESRRTVGRCEWLALPEFGIACIQAGLDAGGASELRAFDVVILGRDGDRRARFSIRPIPGDERTAVVAEAPLARADGESAGAPWIRTLVTLGEESWPVELRLVGHDPGRVRLRLGQPAIGGRFAVDPEQAFLAGPPRPG